MVRVITKTNQITNGKKQSNLIDEKKAKKRLKLKKMKELSFHFWIKNLFFNSNCLNSYCSLIISGSEKTNLPDTPLPSYVHCT